MDSVDDVDDVRARLTLHVEYQGRNRIHPAAELGVLRTGDQRGHVLEPHRSAVLVRDHDLAVILRISDLIVGVDRVCDARAVERALRPILIRIADGRAQIVQIQTVGRHCPRVRHDAYGRPLAAADADDADSPDLGYLLRDARVCKVLHFREGHHFRSQPENQHRRIGGIDLGVDRRCGQILRQQVLGAADRRLHLLFGYVDRERQGELQGDDRRAGRTRRGHLAQARHLAELLFQRCGDGRRDDLGTRAWVKRLHLNGRVGHFGKRGQRQLQIGDGADDQDRNHQQRGRDRTQDEYARGVHAGVAAGAATDVIAGAIRFIVMVWVVLAVGARRARPASGVAQYRAPVRSPAPADPAAPPARRRAGGRRLPSPRFHRRSAPW